MSKRIIAVGRVRNGGPVEITAPTLEERLDSQISRNAEVLAMLADYEQMRREPNSFTARGNLDELLDAIENEPGWAESRPQIGLW